MDEYGSLAQADALWKSQDAKSAHHIDMLGGNDINKRNGTKKLGLQGTCLTRTSLHVMKELPARRDINPLSGAHGGCWEPLWGRGVHKAQYGSNGMCGLEWVFAQKV